MPQRRRLKSIVSQMRMIINIDYSIIFDLLLETLLFSFTGETFSWFRGSRGGALSERTYLFLSEA